MCVFFVLGVYVVSFQFQPLKRLSLRVLKTQDTVLFDASKIAVGFRLGLVLLGR